MCLFCRYINIIQGCLIWHNFVFICQPHIRDIMKLCMISGNSIQFMSSKVIVSSAWSSLCYDLPSTYSKYSNRACEYVSYSTLDMLHHYSQNNWFVDCL